MIVELLKEFPQYTSHIANSLTIKKLLASVESENLNNLYWYDLPLKHAVSWLGLFHILKRNFGQKLVGRFDDDEIAGNYGLKTIYFAEPQGDGVNAPNPAVWHCKSLKSRPWFDDLDEIKLTLERKADIIISEYSQIEKYMRTHPDNTSLMESGKWNGLFLFSTQGKKNNEIARLCPETVRIVESLPLCLNYGFVLFSGLTPGSHILPHSGSSNFRLRYHLGVQVPEPESAKIRVGREWRSWKQGKAMSFDDSYEHEVFHKGEKTRVALVIDVWHPSLTPKDIEILSHPVFRTFGKYKKKNDY